MPCPDVDDEREPGRVMPCQLCGKPVQTRFSTDDSLPIPAVAIICDAHSIGPV